MVGPKRSSVIAIVERSVRLIALPVVYTGSFKESPFIITALMRFILEAEGEKRHVAEAMPHAVSLLAFNVFGMVFSSSVLVLTGSVLPNSVEIES